MVRSMICMWVQPGIVAKDLSARLKSNTKTLERHRAWESMVRKVNQTIQGSEDSKAEEYLDEMLSFVELFSTASRNKVSPPTKITSVCSTMFFAAFRQNQNATHQTE